MVSGGTTPYAMYTQLAKHALDWSRVQVTLADERWVPTNDEDSNERRVRGSLLRECAAAARFVGLKNDAAAPEAGAAAAWAAVAAMHRPFDAVLLGMGEDGHIASLFPGGATRSEYLDPKAPPGCVASQPRAAAHVRLSLNLSALLQSRRIFIQIAGDAKWQAYQRACQAGPPEDMPVRAILRQQAVPVEIFWCPEATAGTAS